jgi:hypothetical protein
MIYNVLLISEQKLKESTPINENVDSSELRFSITQAQTIFVQETLGTNLYEKILSLVQTGDINDPLNINYKELLNNFIQPMLISFSYYLALDNFFVKFVNTGLQQFDGEQSRSIGYKEFQYLKQTAKDNAEFNDNLLRRHLVFNNWKYPEYTIVTNNGQLIPEFGGAFKASIVLPPSGRGGRANVSGNYGSDYFNCPYPWWYGGKGSGE